MIEIILKKTFLISFLVISFGIMQVGECTSNKPLRIQDGVAQMFIDDYLIESSITLERTLHQPKKDNDGNFPIIELGDEFGREGASLQASGTIVYDPKIKRYVMFAHGFTITRTDWDRNRIYRFTSEDGMNWIKGDNGSPEWVYPNNSEDFFDPVSGKRAVHNPRAPGGDVSYGGVRPSACGRAVDVWSPSLRAKRGKICPLRSERVSI